MAVPLVRAPSALQRLMERAQQSAPRRLINVRPISRMHAKVQTNVRQTGDVCAGISRAQKPIDIFAVAHLGIKSADPVDQSAATDRAAKLIGMKGRAGRCGDETLGLPEDKIDIVALQMIERSLRMIRRP